jgi:hypothetical protein
MAVKFETDDGVEITPGLRVFTNDACWGTVEAQQFERGGRANPGGDLFDGWFQVELENGAGTRSYDGERMSTVKTAGLVSTSEIPEQEAPISPSEDEEVNATRAHRAQCALEAYADASGLRMSMSTDPANDDGSFVNVAGDLIADLCHLADQHGWSPEELMGRAELHFGAEHIDPVKD